jgi:hypothetical protein
MTRLAVLAAAATVALLAATGCAPADSPAPPPAAGSPTGMAPDGPVSVPVLPSQPDVTSRDREDDTGWVDGDAATPDDLLDGQRTGVDPVPDGAVAVAAEFAVAYSSWRHDQPEQERVATLQQHTAGDATSQLVAANGRFAQVDDLRTSTSEVAAATIGQIIPLGTSPDGTVDIQIEGTVFRTDVDGTWTHGFVLTMTVADTDNGWKVVRYLEG